MESSSGNSVVFRVPRAQVIAGARIVMLSTTLMAAGCIIVPVPHIDPDYQTDIIDEITLESLNGVHEEEVIGRMGPPDYSGPRGHSYMLVYQGEKHFSTDVVWIVGGMGGAGGGVINTGKTKVLYCFVIELDEDHIVHGNEVIDSALVGTRRDSSDDSVAPIADCSEAVWKPEDRKEVLTKTAYLEVQAEAGDRAAALVLASDFDDLTYLKALAKEGDREAIFLLAREFHVKTDLKALAESGDLTAVALLARYGNELGPLRSSAESGNCEAAHTIAEEFEDDTRDGFVVGLDAWSSREIDIPASDSPQVYTIAEVRDLRPDRTRIGERFAAFGMSMGNVYFFGKVDSVLLETVSDELRGAGHTVQNSGPGRSLSLDILSFWIRTDTTALYWDVVANILINVRVDSTLESTRFHEREFSCDSSQRTYIWPSEELFTEVLNNCLEDLMREFRSDKIWH